jgi:hypothetical protein
VSASEHWQLPRVATPSRAPHLSGSEPSLHESLQAKRGQKVAKSGNYGRKSKFSNLELPQKLFSAEISKSKKKAEKAVILQAFYSTNNVEPFFVQFTDAV